MTSKKYLNDGGLKIHTYQVPLIWHPWHKGRHIHSCRNSQQRKRSGVGQIVSNCLIPSRYFQCQLKPQHSGIKTGITYHMTFQYMYVLRTDRNSQINLLHIGTYDKYLNISLRKSKAVFICLIADLPNSMVILDFYVLF